MDAPQTDAPAWDVDAFILFNEKEESVEKIVGELMSFGTSTYFWRRDMDYGERWEEIESDRLILARIVVLFLGPRGWGPNHLKLAEQGRTLRKAIFTVVIDEPPKEALDQAQGLFRRYRYFDLRRQSVQALAEEIRKRVAAVPSSATLHAFIGALLERYGIKDATPLTHDLLAQAARINLTGRGSAEISTTRLLIAMFEIGVMALDTDDHFGVVALSRVLGSDERFAGFMEIRSSYLAEVKLDVEIRDVTPTENIIRIRTAASPTMAAVFESEGSLRADHLVAAFLSQAGTEAAGRLQSKGIPLADLRSALFAEVARLDPPRAGRWRAALAIPASVDQPTPPKPPATGTDTPDSPASPESTPITYAWMGNDNPDREKLDDKLGVNDEAKAFARVAAARQVAPPLAFGIFGDWGSGKSFFMRLMQEHVDKLADGKTEEAKGGLFHSNIVQIRFNAWHYAETNLWASLVDHIFSELDRWVLQRAQPSQANKLFDNLATARELTLEPAEQLVRRRKEQKAAAERLAGAEGDLAAAREKVGATPRLFWDVVLTNFKAAVGSKQIEDVGKTLGLDRLAHDAESLKQALDSLQVEGERTKAVANGVRHRLLAAPSLVFILMGVVLVPPGLILLRDSILGWPRLGPFVAKINESVLGIAGVLASVAGLVGTIAGKVRRAVAKLEGYRDELNKIIERQVEQPDKKVKEAQDNLATLTAAVP